MDCPSIPQLDYDEFSERFHQRIAEMRIPVSGTLEVTSRCNLRCLHCYVPLEARSDRVTPDLPRSDIERILAEVADAGCLWLLLTGGEPFMRPDFPQIYLYAKHKGLILTVFTNGTLLNKRSADFLAEWRPFKVEITLYGATQETYEKVTGIPGSYTRCRQGIELLAERKIPFSLKTVLMTLNRQELEAMQSIAKALGAQFRFDTIINPGIDGSLGPISLRLTPEEVVAVEKADPLRSANWPGRFRQASKVKPRDKSLYLCGAGRNSFFIDAAGQLSLCMVARQPAYDVLKGSFKEGWEEFLSKVIAREYSETYICANCELRATCNQCPAMGQLEHGDPEKRVEFLCQIAKLRYDIFAPQNDV